MIVPWGAVGPTTAVGVCKPPHAPEKGVWEGPHAILHFVNNGEVLPFPRALVPSLPCYLLCLRSVLVCVFV
eukprot:scaffold6813_cov123-Isochrysis_galbana.AAC.8